MEVIQLEQDITIMCINAQSFPSGVMAAHQKLHSLVPYSTQRRYFGISRPEDGGQIIYRAGAEELISGEAKNLGLNSIVIKKGNYVSEVLHDYMKNIADIGNAFQQMIARPDIDPQGYCIEWYISDTDVQCMVRLAD